MKQIQIPEGKKAYFASDNHLGAPDRKGSLSREKKFVRWLDLVRSDAAVIFLLGDLFDFWFEYRTVIPRGFTRVLGKLAEITDSGVPVLYFVGNHDLWMDGYFEEELNIQVFHSPQQYQLNGSRFLIGHGDGLGPGDKGYKRMKKVFTNPLSKWAYRWLHPDLGVRLAQYFSLRNKAISGEEEVPFQGEEKEWLVQYAKRKLELEPIDYFVFGHRHLPLEIQLSPDSTYVNLGDWITVFSYGEFNGRKLSLQKFEG